MSDLLSLFDPALQSLSSLGRRAGEVEHDLGTLLDRVANDQTHFETRSKNLVPRAQALVSKLGTTQTSMRAAFDTMKSQVVTFRDGVHELEIEYKTQWKALLAAIAGLQSEHLTLQGLSEGLHGHTHGIIHNHGIEAQNQLQLLAPLTENLDGLVRNTMIPVTASLGDTVVHSVDAAGKHIVDGVVPTLFGSAKELGDGMHTGAENLREQAKKLAADMERHTEELMKAAITAAEKVNSKADSRILELVGEVALDITAAMDLIRNIQGCRRGLHSANRVAMSTLGTITKIIDDLALLVRNLEQGGG